MKNGTFSQVSEEENCLFVESIINENYRLITKGLKHHIIKGRGEGGGGEKFQIWVKTPK